MGKYLRLTVNRVRITYLNIVQKYRGFCKVMVHAIRDGVGGEDLREPIFLFTNLTAK